MSQVIRIVLVEPEQARNIGAVVRVAANFGLRRVVVVREAGSLSAEELREVRVASAGAVDVVEIDVRPTLRLAVKGTSAVVGTSGRRRNSAVPVHSSIVSFIETERTAGSRGGAKEVNRDGFGPGGGTAEPDGGGSKVDGLVGAVDGPPDATRIAPIAVVFGRESQGLTADELALCHGILSLPVSPEFPSMNLSHAVAVVLCQAMWMSTGSDYPESRPQHQATGDDVPGQPMVPRIEAAAGPETEPASPDLQEAWFKKLEPAARDAVPPVNMQQLRHLLHRARPTRDDMALLFNLLKLPR